MKHFFLKLITKLLFKIQLHTKLDTLDILLSILTDHQLILENINNTVGITTLRIKLILISVKNYLSAHFNELKTTKLGIGTRVFWACHF